MLGDLWKRAGKYNRVTLWVSEPVLPVPVLAPATRLEHFDRHLFRSVNGCVKVFELKPQDESVPVRAARGIAKRSVVMLHLPFVQLKDESSIGGQALVLDASVAADQANQSLVPTTDHLDVVDADQRSELHSLPFVSPNAAAWVGLG
mgnify:CR=1 FL=1